MTTPDLFETQAPEAPAKRQMMNGKPVFTVPSKTIVNFESGFSHKLLCSGPTFTAGTSCPFSCAFCFVADAMKKQTPWLEKHGVTGKHEDIVIRRGNAVEIARHQLEHHDPWSRKEHKVIYASPLTDVAANLELVKETVEICKVILSLTNWDIRLLSKSNLLPMVAKSFDIGTNEGDQAKRRIIYGVSTGTLDDKLAAAFEQGTALVSKRIQSLHWLQDNGFRTFGMICPSLPQPDYQKFSDEMASAIRADKCDFVWGEVLNARGESFTRTLSALSKADFHWQADEFAHVSRDKAAWEKYARDTFCAHAKTYAGQTGPDGTPKLRFLQYVTKETRDWWQARKEEGAILL